MEQKILTSHQAHDLNKKVAEAIEDGFVPLGSHMVVVKLVQNQYSGNQFMRSINDLEYSQTVVREVEQGVMSDSWQVGRAQAVFDGIYEGDTMVYEHVDFNDITSEAFDFEEGTTNYEIETAMNKSLLNNGYEWKPLAGGEFDEEVLVKSK